MDTLKDLLSQKNLEQPSEMKSIQGFLSERLGHPFSVKDYPDRTTISVKSGKVSYLLRTMLPALESYAAPTKTIHIKVDSRIR